MFAKLWCSLPSTAVHLRRSRYAFLVGCGVLALTLTTGCGAASSAGTAVASSSSVSAVSTATNSGRVAYLTCLRQHGATVPTARPTAHPSGGSSSPASQVPASARQACASLRPSGSGTNQAAVKAFDACMAAQGEAIPSTRPTAMPSPRPTSARSGIDRFLRGLDPGNAKVAAALKACESKLPSSASDG